MRVWIVTHTDWDTDGNVAPITVVGVYSSESLIPDRFTDSHSYESYDRHEIEVDKIETWEE